MSSTKIGLADYTNEPGFASASGLIKESASSKESGSARISQLFGDAPFVTQQLLEMENGNYFFKLNELADFIEKSPESRTSLVRQIVEQGGSARLVRPDRLAGLESLNSILGRIPPR